MNYSINQVSEITGLSAATLRYYDKEGLLPDLKRKHSRYRVFSEHDLETLKIIRCFKQAGLKIKDMKYYMQLLQHGDRSLPERYEMFVRQERLLKEKLAEIQQSLAVVRRKQEYYKKAMQLSSELLEKNIPKEAQP